MSYKDHFIQSVDGVFEFDGDTCILCEVFYNTMVEENCKNCPIFIVHGFECDANNSRIYQESKDNPQPMIDLLRSTLYYYL